MRVRLKKTVVLVGMMGAGKTAVGKALAAKIGAPFLDSDAEITEAANMTIPEIFERDGEAFFRKREREVLGRLLQSGICILSTGGGTFMSQQNRDLIAQSAVSLCLDCDVNLLWNRVRHKTTRPLLQTNDPFGTLRQIYARRAPIYALSDLTVGGEADRSIGAMTQKVLAALRRHGTLEEKDDA